MSPTTASGWKDTGVSEISLRTTSIFGTRTDVNGHFSMPFRAGKVRVSVIGYETRNFTVKEPNDSLVFKIEAIESALSTAVVTGKKEKYSRKNNPVDEGFNVIVMPGYAFGGAIVEAAPEFPDVKFIALDVAAGDLLETAVAKAGESYDYNPSNWDLNKYVDMSNVYCAVYQEELCGYMAGYAAVKLGYKNLGFLGGMAVPAVIRYGYGFVQGADAAAAELGQNIEIN